MNLVSKISAVATLLSLGAVSAAAPIADVVGERNQGSGQGRWVQVSPRSTIVEALLANRDGLVVYKLDALMVGEGSGHIYGELDEVAPKGSDPKGSNPSLIDRRLILDGEYIDIGNGQLYVRSQILWDLSPFGLDQLVPVGVLDGQLFDFGPSGYCPGPLDPMELRSDSELHALPSGDAGAAAQQLGEIEPVTRFAPIEQPHGKFIATWFMF